MDGLVGVSHSLREEIISTRLQGIGLDRPKEVQVNGLPMPQLKRQGRTADKAETLEHGHGLKRLQKLQCSGFDCLVL